MQLTRFALKPISINKPSPSDFEERLVAHAAGVQQRAGRSIDGTSAAALAHFFFGRVGRAQVTVRGGAAEAERWLAAR